jgi:hypothetical protein
MNNTAPILSCAIEAVKLESATGAEVIIVWQADGRCSRVLANECSHQFQRQQRASKAPLFLKTNPVNPEDSAETQKLGALCLPIRRSFRNGRMRAVTIGERFTNMEHTPAMKRS